MLYPVLYPAHGPLEGLEVTSNAQRICVRRIVDTAVECTKLCCSPVSLTVLSEVPEMIATTIISDEQCVLRNLVITPEPWHIVSVTAAHVELPPRAPYCTAHCYPENLTPSFKSLRNLFVTPS